MSKKKKWVIVSSFSQNLLNKRLLKNLSQRELGDIVGMDGGRISKMERGEVTVSIQTVERIAKGLGVNYLELLVERPQK